MFKNLEVLEDNYFGCINNFVHLEKFLNLLQTCIKILHRIMVIVKSEIEAHSDI